MRRAVSEAYRDAIIRLVGLLPVPLSMNEEESLIAVFIRSRS